MRSINTAVVTIIAILFLSVGCNQTEDQENKSLENDRQSDTAQESVKEPYKESTTEERMGKIKGIWIDVQLSRRMDRKIGYQFVVSEDSRLYVQSCNPDEETPKEDAMTTLSSFATELRDDKTRYTNIENPTEYYVIDKMGNLMIYDELGLIVTCLKVFVDFR